MVGNIWGMDGPNLVVVRAAKAVSIGTSTVDNRSNARGGTSTGDIDRCCEAQRHNRQTHSCRRSTQSTTRGARSTRKAKWKLLVIKPTDL
jgi:hypothetical protein